MDVYRLDTNADMWAGFFPSEQGDWHQFDPIVDGTSVASGWEPVAVYRFDAEGKRGHGDFSTLNAVPTFTGRAVEALSDLLEGCGELLPLTVADGGEAYAYNVTRLSDALDRERAKFEYYRSGGIMAVDDYVFDPEGVVGETIFKLAVQPRGYEYVTDRFRDRVEQAGLTGFRWRPPVWSGG